MQDMPTCMGKLTRMYGKFFASTFTGSMMASGAEVFAVWAYVIANTVKSRVELNPRLLAAVIGSTPDRMQAAIDKLCAPDEESRSTTADGRRIVKEDGFQYFVVNHMHYRAMRDEDDRRAYFKDKKREQRERDKASKSQAVSNEASKTVKDSQRQSSMSTQAEAEAEAEADKTSQAKSKTTRKRSPAAPSLTVEALCLDGLAEDLAIEYLAMRERKRARLTAMAWAGVASEVRKAGLSLDDGIAKALARGWVGFDASWVKTDSETAYSREKRETANAWFGTAATIKRDFIEMEVENGNGPSIR